ncbi:MAG TPA: BTAD domain-containing putative transcriptional regulator [Micromonosporaceae bacterium]|nr:BTAD domain-containing putative transcriptional regulator [Micromonosporaceae bacterium]
MGNLRVAAVGEPGHMLGKIVPPVLAPSIVERPRATARLVTAVARRLAVLTAGPGFGKTTLLATWAEGHHCAWYSVTAVDRDPFTFARGLVTGLTLRVPGLADDLAPALEGGRGPDVPVDDAVAAFVPALAGALHARLGSDVTLVIDDVQELDGHPASARLLADLCHMAPPRLHVVLSSRGDPPFGTERLRLHGHVHVLTGETLAFDRADTARLLRAVAGQQAERHAATVERLTGGWPAAVRLVAEALAGAPGPDAVLDGLVARGGTVDLVGDLLEREVFGAGDGGLVEVVRVGAVLDGFNADLLAALGVPDAADVVGRIRRRGIHVTPAAGTPDWYSLTPVTRDYAVRRLGSDPADVARLRRAAASWHAARGESAVALRYLTQAGDGEAAARLLRTDGPALLAAGHAAAVLEALAIVPDAARSPELDLVEGEACQVRGDWSRAVERLARLVPGSGPAPAAAAWRLGLIHHLRGDLDAALDVYARGLADEGGAAADRALSGAWGAAAVWLRGDVERCRQWATEAEALAAVSGSHRALAATHTALAMLAALDGDRRSNDMHYLRALDHAQRAGDVLQLIRIRANRGSRFLEEGYYAEALAELDTAVGFADLAGFAALRMLALYNRGEAARRLGRLEEATADFTAALAEGQRLGSRMAAYALNGLGDVNAEHGNSSLARASYEEALGLAEPAGDVQGIVPALAGLALALAPDDPDEAERVAARALAYPPSLGRCGALLAAARVAARRGDRSALRQRAEAAAALARSRRDRAGLAEALELRAAYQALDPAASAGASAAGSLREALALWESLGCPLPLARTRLALARLAPGADTAATLDEVERVTRDRGARGLAADAAAVRRELTHRSLPEVSLRTLGGFRVQLAGGAVPHAGWPSRSARDVLKILAAHRGGPVDLAEIGRLLRPTDPEPAAARHAAEAVGDVRRVLDPAGRWPADRYVAADEVAAWLRTEHVEVDVEVFLRRAETALEKPGGAGVDDLAVAEVAYTGDFCAEDAGAPWARPLRDEARSRYVAVTRELAGRYAAEGDHETAVRYLLRLLGCEPYDERAHLALVRALDAGGRHKDARQVYRAYDGRMDELGVPAEPYPEAVTGPVPGA